MITLCIGAIATADGQGVVFSDRHNVSEDLVTTCPEKYRGEEIDGMINLYCSEIEECPLVGSRPFRRAEKGGYDCEVPIFEWENPDDPIEEITIAQPMSVPVDGMVEQFWVTDGYVVPVRYAES